MISEPRIERNIRLLPCPFCGSEAMMEVQDPHTHGGGIASFMPDSPGYVLIECRGCAVAMMLSGRDIAAGAAKWNRRQP